MFQEELFYENPSNKETHGQLTWCHQCERVNRTKDWEDNKWNCPDSNCNGCVSDAFPWVKGYLPRIVHPEYPDFPEIGRCYPSSRFNYD
jgi:hypothetical protein